jgi:hypothetical protein
MDSQNTVTSRSYGHKTKGPTGLVIRDGRSVVVGFHVFHMPALRAKKSGVGC